MMIKDIIDIEAKSFETELREFFDNKKEFYPDNLYKAMEYSLFGRGKRIRPIIVRLCADFLDINRNKLKDLAIALELIHTYSLIHDDLPCMDNDDYRRGKPTCHKMYGEAMAILAGDALLNLAYETALESVSKDNKLFISALLLSKCSGAEGMIGGQVEDITLENPSEQEILSMYSKKTACLIRTAALIPAYLHINEIVYEDLNEYGEKLGLIFQLSDDMLDKNVIEKNSYISNIGEQETLKLINKLNADIKKIMSKYDSKADLLIQLADYVANRKR